MDNESSVEKLQRKLYSRVEKIKPRPRRALHETEHEEVPEAWSHPGEEESEVQAPEDAEKLLDDLYHGHIRGRQGFTDDVVEKKETSVGSRFLKVFFLVSVLFFVFSAGFAGYYLVGGKNAVSCKNVNINISGPRSIASGKKLSLDVMITNTNPVAMRNATVEFIYPKGTREADYSSVNLPSKKEEIGTIEMNERVRTVARSILFGQEQTEHEIKAIVSYGIDDSSASFVCEKTYAIFIATAPVSITVKGLEEISSGQQIELNVAIFSNSEELVPDQRLIVEYPYGFEVISSSQEPTADKNVWDLGDISPNMERLLTIRGTVTGQGIESKMIKFLIGDKDPVDEKKIGTVLQMYEHPLLVTRPFLSLDMIIGGENSPQVVRELGDTISGTVVWKNDLSYALHDLEIDLKIKGVMLEKSSVTASQGFFRSVDSTITWTPQTTGGKFRVLEPGEEGRLQYSFKTRPFDTGISVENPYMNIEFDVRARRISDNIPVPQTLLGQSKRTILFNSELTLQPYAIYSTGPFTNTGPHPPRVDRETTYTIAWEVSNTTNNLQNVQVRGVLPVYVSWVGPTQGDGIVSFNPVTREVVWSVGDVPRGVGSEVHVRRVYFQVSATPSISQLQREIELVSSLKAEGVDGFTKDVLVSSVRSIVTTLAKDPMFGSVSGRVER